MQEQKLRKGPWFEEEDERLTAIVGLIGERRWDALAKASGLRRSGKSCRLRWMNYLRPNLRHGRISQDEEKIIAQLHQQWGNKWSKIATRLPGRTDNEIKNYWRSHLRKKFQAQELGNFRSVLHDVEQKLPKNDEGTNTQSISFPKCTSEKDEISESSFESLEAFQPSDYTIMNSPYENRVSHWISEWSYKEETNDIIHNLDYCGADSCYCYMTRLDSESQTSLWDYSSSVWNMDYR